MERVHVDQTDHMIVADHIIFSTYGFWLPNDPRGSWSDFVGSWDLYRHSGKATKTNERCSVARCDHDHEKRIGAKTKLKYPAVILTGVQARTVGQSFAGYFSRTDTPRVWACAILPDHVHLVVERGRLEPRRLTSRLKAAATRALLAEDQHPLVAHTDQTGRTPKCFARGAWAVYLKSDSVARAIEYVNNNPVKEGLRPQRWSFVVPSPYASS